MLGEKVYVVVAPVFTAGDHVPAMLLLELAGSVNAVPAHTTATWVKLGVVGVLTATLIVVVFAQAMLGVKVYVVVAVVFTAGDHVPAMLFVDVAGSVNAVPAHTAATWVKVGVVALLTTTLIVVVFAQAMLGVNV
jgi:hypothetical protein